MRAFANHRADIVTQALDGVVAIGGGRVMRSAPDSHARLVIRGDWDKSRVAVISGGGSGHEPSHAGLVGQGLLTAAVCGEIFASPSVDAVLSAITAVTGASGCMLIVKNYTGDRLNFGLAAERARLLGFAVEMVVVADDIAIPGAQQPRGIAGTLFIHKLAGHLSERGADLAEIARAVEAANSRIFSLGVARDTCTVPGNPKQQRIPDGAVEIGLGIHGEPGVEITEVAGSRELIANLAARLAPRMKPSAHYALLFNNLGGLTGLECLVLLSDLLRTELMPRIKYFAGPAAVMTALDMAGFSVSFVELDDGLEQALLAPVEPPAFPAFRPVQEPGIAFTPPDHPDEVYPASSDATVRRVLDVVTDACSAMAAAVNELDARVGDGDTGSTFAGAARSIRARIDHLPLADRAALLSSLSDLLRKGMGGSSGVLLAILFAKAADSSRAGDSWPRAMLAGLAAMQKYGGARPGDRTMIDALLPALTALDAGDAIAVAAGHARRGADGTAAMLRAGAGRSAYLEARSLAGVNDPGAEAVARIFEALAVAFRP